MSARLQHGLALTIADTEMAGPPQAVNVSATWKGESIPGSVTAIELTTGQVCSPSEGTSLDCTRKPTAAALLGGSVNRRRSDREERPSPVS